MKRTFINIALLKPLVLVVACHLTVSTYAQTKIYNAEPLSDRLQKIGENSGRNVAFNKQLLKNITASEISGDIKSPEELLSKSLVGTGFTFRLLGEKDFMIVRSAFQQGIGRLSGKIVNEVGEPVAGAVISVAGKTAITDNNGDFSLDVPSGVYTLTIKAEKYNALRVEKLTIANNETNTVSFALKAASEKETAIKEVVITGLRKADTQAGLLAQQKKAAQMSDGISAEQITKTPDSDVGATLKRVTGITTIDNKYVVVRSMGERWNTAAMDGINLPSTEAYNNNFSFDIIPTAMVESVVVSKTATPDMNASFAGGYVEVKTKDIPNEDFITVSMGTSYNDISTSKEFLTRQRGKYDYWGYDDGTRDFPSNLQTSDVSTDNFFEQSKRFTNDNFTTYKTKADMGSNMQLALGRVFKSKKSSNKWGFAGAITTKNEQNKLDIDHTSRGGWIFNADRFDDTEPTTFYDFKNKGASYTYSSTLAGMLNFGLQLGKHRFSFRNTYTHTADIALTRITGWNEYSGSGNPEVAEAAYQYFYNGILPEGATSPSGVELPRTTNYNYPVYQQLLQNKLEGNHKLGNIEINWFAARTAAAYDTKDFTSSTSYYGVSGNEIYAYYQIYNSSPGHYRRNTESESEDWNFGADFSFKLDKNQFKNTIKVGYFGTLKDNTNLNNAAALKVDPTNPNVSNNILRFYSFEELFAGSPYEAGGIGWGVIKRYGNQYHGKVTQHAPYMMFDNRLGTQWRLVWGARAEYYKYKMLESQRENAEDEGFEETQLDDKLWQILPSANFTYSPTSNINLRLAYNKSVMRPSFLERTAIPFYDPIATATVINATGVVSSVADNYDFKFEWFPGLGEILSLSAYHKVIDRPIERVGFTTTEGNLQLFVVNSKKAVLTGFEAELRKSLGFIIKDSFLDNLFVSANFTYNETKVTGYVDRFGIDKTTTYEADRPLYGQTPWAYNLGLAYDGDRLGLNVVHNAKGDQYLTVGYAYRDEEIQRPYQTTDVQISYRMLKDKNLQFKFSVKNLFNTPVETYNNWLSYMTDNPDFNGEVQQVREARKLSPGATDKYDKDVDELMFRAYRGTTFSLGVNYTF